MTPDDIKELKRKLVIANRINKEKDKTIAEMRRSLIVNGFKGLKDEKTPAMDYSLAPELHDAKLKIENLEIKNIDLQNTVDFMSESLIEMDQIKSKNELLNRRENTLREELDRTKRLIEKRVSDSTDRERLDHSREIADLKSELYDLTKKLSLVETEKTSSSLSEIDARAKMKSEIQEKDNRIKGLERENDEIKKSAEILGVSGSALKFIRQATTYRKIAKMIRGALGGTATEVAVAQSNSKFLDSIVTSDRYVCPSCKKTYLIHSDFDYVACCGLEKYVY